MTVPRFVKEYKNHVLEKIQGSLNTNDAEKKHYSDRAEKAVLYAERGVLTIDEAMETLCGIVSEVRMIW